MRLYNNLSDSPEGRGPAYFAIRGWSPIATINVTWLFGLQWGEAKRRLLENKPPTRETVQAVAHRLAPDQTVVLDLEGQDWTRVGTWNADLGNHGEWDLYEDNLRLHVDILRWMQEANPSLRLGIYSTPYVFKALARAEAADNEWWQERVRPVVERWRADLQLLADAQDFLCPSLYWTPSRSPWLTDGDVFLRYAQRQIHHAKQFSRPVLPYISFWDPYSQNYMATVDWSNLLELCRDECGGAVVWSDMPFNFEKDAKNHPWWDVCNRMLAEDR